MFGLGMISILAIFIALVIVSLVLAAKGFCWDMGEKIAISSVVVSVMYLVWLMFSLITFVFYSNCESNTFKITKVGENTIRSLKPDNKISGSFILGSGGINSSGCFYTLVEIDKDTFQKYEIYIYKRDRWT